MIDILYTNNEANALTHSEMNEDWRKSSEILKAKLILDNIQDKNNLVDIGCGWGSTLIQLNGKIEKLVGIDESSHRAKNLIDNYSEIKFFEAHSSKLPLEDSSYSNILMSHIFHEISQFSNDENKSIKEVSRVLKKNGYLIIIDHSQPPNGYSKVIFKIEKIDQLNDYIAKFKGDNKNFKIEGNIVTSDIWSVHEFVTKIWSLSTEAENLEMNETHLSLNLNELDRYISQFGFEKKIACYFNPITSLMNYYGIELLSNNDWGRQFFLVMKKK